MILRHEALKGALERKDSSDRLVVTPLLDKEQVGPSSIDLRLGTRFYLLRRTEGPGLDPKLVSDSAQVDTDAYEAKRVRLGDGLWLHPGQFVLGSTLEYLRIPLDLSGYVIGRSTWGRVGLIVATAILVHPGFTGALTLELANEGDSPICLYPGVRIAQLSLHHLEGATKKGYGKQQKYFGDTGPQIPRLDSEANEVTRVQAVSRRLSDGLA